MTAAFITITFLGGVSFGVAVGMAATLVIERKVQEEEFNGWW